MYKPAQRILALILCLCLLVLAGCQPDSTTREDNDPVGSPAASAQETSSGSGRYLEERLELPGHIVEIYALEQMDNGSFWLIGAAPGEALEEGGYTQKIEIWYSEDNGGHWQEHLNPWMDDDAFDGLYLNEASFDVPGSVYLYMTRYEELPGQEDAEGLKEYNVTHYMYHLDGDGLTSLDQVVAALESSGAGLSEFRALPQGQLLLVFYRRMDLVDVETGRTLFSYDMESIPQYGAYRVFNGRLMVADDPGIASYSLENGSKADIVIPYAIGSYTQKGGSYSPTPLGMTALAAEAGNQAVYYANSYGIYRAMLDGSYTEKLLDGDLCSLGLPSLSLFHVYSCDDGSFLTFCYDSGYKLYRYRFDPDVPSAPNQELKVYSLYDNDTVRQAMGQFQLDRPEARVTYQVGVTEDNGITAADALRSLSADILGGRGPDLLILDGLPVESYMEKEMLVDLAPLLDARIESGELLANIANTYRRQDHLWMIPARFTVPMLQGKDSGQVTDLSSLTEWVESRPVPIIGISSQTMVSKFYELLGHTWFAENGSLDDEAFTRDLALIGRLADMAREHEEAHPMGVYTIDSNLSLIAGALNLKAGSVEVSIGLLGDTGQLSVPFALEEEAGIPRLFPATGLYIPNTLLGISSGSSRQELAAEFLLYILSPEVLDISFQDGLPVNTLSLDRNMAHPGDMSAGTLGSTLISNNAETGQEEYVNVHIEYDWPREDALQEYRRQIESLNTAALQNAVVKEIIVAECAPFLAGELSLEDTIRAVKSKLDIYLAE